MPQRAFSLSALKCREREGEKNSSASVVVSSQLTQLRGVSPDEEERNFFSAQKLIFPFSSSFSSSSFFVLFFNKDFKEP